MLKDQLLKIKQEKVCKKVDFPYIFEPQKPVCINNWFRRKAAFSRVKSTKTHYSYKPSEEYIIRKYGIPVTTTKSFINKLLKKLESIQTDSIKHKNKENYASRKRAIA